MGWLCIIVKARKLGINLAPNREQVTCTKSKIGFIRKMVAHA